MPEPLEPTGGAPGGAAQDRVAALFNRALEEQVAEQRAVTTLLAEVRERLNRLDEIQSGVDGSVQRGIGPVAAELRSTSEELTARLDELGRRVEAATAELRSLPTGAELSQLRGGLREDLRGDLQAGRDADLQVAQAADAETARALDARLAQLQDRLAGLEALLPRLAPQTAVDEVSDGLAGVRTDLRQLPEQVGGAVGGRLAEPLEALREAGTSQRDALGAVSQGLATLITDLGRIEHGLPPAVLDGLTPVLAGGLGPVVESLAALEAQVAGLAARVAALDELPEGVRDLGSRLVALPAGPDASVAAVHGDVRLLAERLDTVVEAVRTLPAEPAEDRSLPPLADLAASVGLVSAGVAALSDAVHGSAEDVSALHPRLQGLTDRVTAVEAALPGVSEGLGGLGSVPITLAGVVERLDGLSAQLRDGDPARDAEALDRRLTELSAEVAALAGPLAQLGVRFGALDAQLAGLDTQIAGVDAALAGVDATVAGVSATLARTPDPAEQPDLAGIVGTAVSGSVAAAGEPLVAEVAGLRADLDTLRRLVLEDLPVEAPDLAGARQDMEREVTTGVVAALQELVRTEVAEQVRSSVQGAVGQFLDERLADAVRPHVADAVDSAVERAGGGQAASESRLRSHVDEAVLALAEVVLRGGTLRMPEREGAADAAMGAPAADTSLGGPRVAAVVEPSPERPAPTDGTPAEPAQVEDDAPVVPPAPAAAGPGTGRESALGFRTEPEGGGLESGTDPEGPKRKWFGRS